MTTFASAAPAVTIPAPVAIPTDLAIAPPADLIAPGTRALGARPAVQGKRVPVALSAATVLFVGVCLVAGIVVNALGLIPAALGTLPLLGWLRLRRLACAETAPAPAHTASAALWAPAAADVEISVVIPFYNPGNALRPNVQRLVTVLDEADARFEVIAVSDGSTDGSELTLEGISPDVRVIVAPRNAGKGAALHRGFAASRGRYVGFVDADGDIDPVHLLDYLERMRTAQHDAVFASKRHADSSSESSLKRKIISRTFSRLVQLLFRLPVNDTQTGCKLFRREVLADLLPSFREQRFAFDLEFFAVARSAGYRDFCPAPVRLEERLAGSTVGTSAIVRTLKDVVAIYARLTTTDAYPQQAAAAPMPVTSAYASLRPAVRTHI